MEVKVQLPFQELVTIVRQLSPAQKAKLQKELATEEPKKTNQHQRSRDLLNSY
jgi:hypothetical protein